jgi:hydroxymethylglutaryl-CoA lyase
MNLTSSVFIREVGPREGLQTSSQIVSTADKLKLIELLSASGVKEIEITSMVRPDRVPQMADSEDLIGRFRQEPGVRYTALYLNRKGFARAEASGRLGNQGWIYSATSDTFLKKNANTSRAEILTSLPEWLGDFKGAGKELHGVMVSTAFGCAYEGKGAAANLFPVIAEIFEALERSGVTPRELSLADTVGLGTPEVVKRAVGELKAKYSRTRISLHLHDTRGTGIANAYAGLLEGADCFDASVGGVGGCPFTPGAAGNIATEDLVYLLEEMGISTGISQEAYAQAARFLEQVLGTRLPGKYYRSSRS